MDSQELLRVFASGDEGAIVGALFYLSGTVEGDPGKEVLERATRFFLHSDVDVRRQAIVAVAIHWGCVPSLGMMFKVLEVEREEFVLKLAVSAVARIGEVSTSARGEILLALRGIVLDGRYTENLRHLAFVEARWMCGEMSADEYAKVCLRPERVPIDLDWFERVLYRA